MFVSREIFAISRRLKDIFELENIGDYDRAIELLKVYWSDITQMPDVTNLPADIAAELILRCGSILNYLGNARQIPHSHETAKNLLSVAREQFLILENIEKVCECENHLALSYFHKAEYDESIVWIEQSLMRRIEFQNYIRFHSHIIKSMIMLAEAKYKSVITYLELFEEDFKLASDLMRGSFSTNKSIAYEKLGDLDNSFLYLSLARKFHTKSRHLPYLATVENNLAMIYKQRHEFDLALSSADNAITLFYEIKDSLRAAFSIDTKAQIYIEMGNFLEAEKFADQAAEVLRFGDSSAFLSAVMLTKAKTLLYQEKLAESLVIVADSINISQTSGDKAMLSLAKQFEVEIINKFSGKQTTKPKEPLKLDLPPQIAPDQKLFPVKIVNDDFAPIGLSVGRIAIGTYCDKLNQGDLVVVSDKDNFVTIGFYSNTFGLICLTTLDGDAEPEIFDQSEVIVLGKIIGYCDEKTNERDRYYVNLIPTQKYL